MYLIKKAIKAYTNARHIIHMEYIVITSNE